MPLMLRAARPRMLLLVVMVSGLLAFGLWWIPPCQLPAPAVERIARERAAADAYIQTLQPTVSARERAARELVFGYEARRLARQLQERYCQPSIMARLTGR